MKKLILFLTFFALTYFVNAQVIIDFKDLTNKTVKSTPEMTVSDNNIDFKNIPHSADYWVKFVGAYLKRFTIQNLNGGQIIIDGSISSNTDSKVFQLVNCKEIKLDLTNARITNGGNSSGLAGSIIYIYGKWHNIKVIGGTLNQTGTSGGAAFQTESYSDPLYSHGSLLIDGTKILNAMGEGFYIGYNEAIKAYLDTLIIRNTDVSNTRRDFWQPTNVVYTLIENNRGNNGALEQNSLHISGFSLNNKNKHVVLRKNIVTKVPQFIYSGTRDGILELDSNIYIQDNHAGPRANQAIYTKTPTTMLGNNITAPNVKEAAIAADGTKVTLIADTNIITAPKLARYANTIIYYTPPPTVKEYVDQIQVIETTTYNGIKTYQFIYKGVELKPQN